MTTTPCSSCSKLDARKPDTPFERGKQAYRPYQHGEKIQDTSEWFLAQLIEHHDFRAKTTADDEQEETTQDRKGKQVVRIRIDPFQTPIKGRDLPPHLPQPTKTESISQTLPRDLPGELKNIFKEEQVCQLATAIVATVNRESGPRTTRP
ncbi:hypothetical protein GY45DRAFT_639082 [Cubamyces sp. BRFM 1775]|nr:hypothetical protein GY45DRAFT_639082 [Cubamyces sp. BRFM 1775]